MTLLLPRAIHSLLTESGLTSRQIDLVMIGALGLLLLMYDLLRAYFGRAALTRLRPFGIAILPLSIAAAIVIGHRWNELTSP